MATVVSYLVYGFVWGLLLVAGVATRPDRSRCPGNWVLDLGVRTDGPHQGEFACAPPPPKDLDDDNGNDPPYDLPRVWGKIYCTGGTRPIQVNYQTVGCQRYPPPPITTTAW